MIEFHARSNLREFFQESWPDHILVSMHVSAELGYYTVQTKKNFPGAMFA